MSLVLVTDLDQDWPAARESLKNDLLSIATYVNHQLAQLVDTQGTIQPQVIAQTITGAALVFPLGGSDQARVPMAASPVYADVLNYAPYAAQSTFLARVRAWAWMLPASSTVRVKVALYNETTGVSVESAWGLATTRATGLLPLFLVAIVAGMTYRLRVITDTGSVGVYAIGQLEAVL